MIITLGYRDQQDPKDKIMNNLKPDPSAPGYKSSIMVPSRQAIQLPGTNWVVWQNRRVHHLPRTVYLGSEPVAVYLWRLPSGEGFTGPRFERELGSEGIHHLVNQTLPWS